MAASISITYICTRALHSLPSFPHCRAAATVIPLQRKVTFTLSIQPNLGLPRTRSPLPSSIDTRLALRCSSILSSCPNHLSTPIHSIHQLSFYSSSLTNFVSLLPYFAYSSSQEHSLFFNLHFSYPNLHFSYPCLSPTIALAQLLPHTDTF